MVYFYKIAPIGAFLLILSCSVSAADTTVGLGGITRYITEGREAIEDSGLAYVNLNWQQESYFFDAWYAVSNRDDVGNDKQRYRELNLFLGHQFALSKSISLQSSYQYLQFNHAALDDHEVSVAVVVDGETLPGGSLSAYYSHQNRGAYIELELNKGLSLNNIQVTPYIIFGLNAGYVAQEHRGLDHCRWGVNIDFLSNEKYLLSGGVVTVGAIDKKTTDSLVNRTWFELKLDVVID